MSKNKDIDLDDLDDTDDFDLDDDFSLEPVKNNRSPIMNIKAGAVESLKGKKNALSFSQKVARYALPSSYGRAIDEISSVASDVTSIYDDTIRAFDPNLTNIRKMTTKALPITNKFLPKKIAEKIKAFASEDNSNYSNSNYDADAAEINSTLQTIFGAQRIENTLKSQADDTHRQVDRAINKKQFIHSMSAQKSMASNLARLVGYQDTILDQFHRKSLEVQYKQFFVTRDLLTLSKASTIDILNQLTAVAKNTALPNEAKVTATESFAQANLNRVVGLIQDSSANSLSTLTRRIRAGVTRESENFLGSLMSNISLTGFGGDDNDSFGMNKYQMLGEFGGSVFRDSLGESLGNGIKDKLPGVLNKIHPKLGEKVAAFGSKIGRLTDEYPAILTRKMRDSNGQGFFGFLDNLIGHNTSIGETINTNLSSEATASVPWDLLSRRTLIEIIPGYLSRSLEQMTNIYNVLSGSDEKSERIVYSTKREAFVNKSEVIKDVTKVTRNALNYRLKDHINEIIDYIDDGSITPSERLELSLILAKDASENIDFDPTYYADSFNLSELYGSAGKIANLFTNSFGITGEYKNGKYKYKTSDSEEVETAREKLATSFNRVRSGLGDFNHILNTSNATGEKEYLKDIGLLDNTTGKVNDQYRWDLVRELLGLDKEEDFYKPNMDKSNITNNEVTGTKYTVNTLDPKNNTEDSLNTLFKGTGDTVNVQSADISKLIDKVNSIDYTDKFDNLIGLTKESTAANLTTLERIAVGIENIKYIAASEAGITINTPTANPIKEKTYASNLLENILDVPKGIFKGGKWLFNKNSQVRTALKPLRSAAFDTATTLGKKAGKLSWGGLKLGTKAGFKLGNLGLRGLFHGTKNAPGRMGDLLSTAGSLASSLKMPIETILSTLIDTGGWAFGKGISTLSKVPGRTIDNLPRLKSMIQAPLGLAGSFLHGLGNIAGFISGKHKDNKITDLFTRSNPNTPIFSMAKLRLGEYYDRLTGKQIISIQDVKGEIIDRYGSIVVSVKDFANGFIDSKGKPVKNIFTNAHKKLASMFPEEFKMSFSNNFNKLSAAILPKLTKRGITKERIMDIYVKGKNKIPTLAAAKIMAGEYYDKLTGKQIYTFKDIKGEVVDKFGNLILTAEDYLAGLVDVNNVPIKDRLSNAFSLIKGLNKEDFTIENVKSAITRVSNYLTPIKDVYLKNETVPRIYASIMKEGGYIDATTGYVIKTVEDIKGAVKDKFGNIILTEEEFKSGLNDYMNKPLVKSAVGFLSKVKNKLLSTKSLGMGLLSPFSLISSLVDKVTPIFEKKEDIVSSKLNDIFLYIQKAFPVEDSEQKEANRSGGVNDIIKKREAAKKAKEAQSEGSNITGDETSKGKKGIISSLLGAFNKNKDKEESSGVWDTIKSGAGWLLGGLGAGAAGSTAVGAASGGAAVATEAAVAGGAAVATEAAVAGGGLAALGSTIALVSNPIGWALLAGAGIFAGYKAYKAISRRTSLKRLELLRFLQYGIPVDNSHAFVTIRYFEEDVSSYIKISESGYPDISKTSKELWATYASDFGGNVDNPTDYKNFSEWFYRRFLPVYVKHTVVAKNLANIKLKDVDSKLSNDLIFKFVNLVQFSDNIAGINPYAIHSSPWKDIAISDNSGYIKTLSEQIKNMAKRGANTTLANLKSIKPTKPTLAPSVTHTVKTLTDTYDKDNAEKQAGLVEDKRSLREKAIDWTSRNVFEKGARVYNEVKSAIVAGAKKVGSTVVTGAKWVNKNIIKPVVNSLAGLIRGAESGIEGYNAYNRGTSGNRILGPVGHKELTKMTIAEILEDSRRPPSDPDRLFAVGKYQMIPATLTDAVRVLGIDPNTTLFDENTQERLFSNFLLDKKRKAISAYIKGKSDDNIGAANAAAWEWASIADPTTGASKYGHGNKASVTGPQILAAMDKSRQLYKQYIDQGMDEESAYQKAVSSDGSDLIANSNKDNTANNTSTASIVPTPINSGAPFKTTPNTTTVAQNPMLAAKPAPADNSISVIDSAVSNKPSLAQDNTQVVMPDLSHISKTTLSTAADAAKQRDLHIDEAKKTNELLAQLVDNSLNAKPNTTIIAGNTNTNNSPGIKPVLNLQRKS